MTQCNTTATPTPNSTTAAEAALRARKEEFYADYCKVDSAALDASIMLSTLVQLIDHAEIKKQGLIGEEDNFFWGLSGLLGLVHKFLCTEAVYQFPSRQTVRELLGLPEESKGGE